jgi:hypothetical protein
MSHINCSISLSAVEGFNELKNTNEEKTKILKLNKINVESSNQTYKIIRYDKNILNIDLIPTYGLFRSVILNNNNDVVCFAPPKSIPADIFMKKYPVKNENLIAQEFVEGTMINVFWNPTFGLTGGWEIATRNVVGAETCFYLDNTSKSFRTLFLEAAKECNLIIEHLNEEFCYSFVLQHPENRIVVPLVKKNIYLIGIYRIINIDKNNVVIYPFSVKEIHTYDWSKTTISFPKIYVWENYSDLIETYASMNSNYDIQGVVIYNVDNYVRTKIRNPVYEQVKQLRGNQPKLQYQYLCLRSKGEVCNFLKFYPENKKKFSTFRDQVHLFTNTLFQNYISCFIKKEKPLLEFPDQYRNHMFKIHEMYRNELKEKKLYVNNSVVIKYVNQLHPTLIMYSLNFHMRKRKMYDKSIQLNNI